MPEQLYCEKYRPRKFEDVIGLSPKIKQLVGEKMPHLLFVGPPGTGKTTTAKIIIDYMDAEALVLNSSLDRKIETVRDRIRDFARSAPMPGKGKIKIVFLDEADGLLSPVQESLRNFMETYSDNVRFILTCNRPEKIIEPLKSRCAIFKFNTLQKNDIFDVLHHICEQEGVSIESRVVLDILIEKFYPDVRKMINELQFLSNNATNPISKDKMMGLKTIYDKVIEAIKAKSFEDARQVLINEMVDPEEFFTELYMRLIESDRPMEIKEKVNQVAMQCNFYISGAHDKMIALEGFIFGLLKVGI